MQLNTSTTSMAIVTFHRQSALMLVQHSTRTPTQILFEDQTPMTDQDAEDEAQGASEGDSLEALIYAIQPPQRALTVPNVVSSTG